MSGGGENLADATMKNAEGDLQKRANQTSKSSLQAPSIAASSKDERGVHSTPAGGRESDNVDDESDAGSDYDAADITHYLTLRINKTLEVDAVTFVHQNVGLAFALMMTKFKDCKIHHRDGSLCKPDPLENMEAFPYNVGDLED